MSVWLICVSACSFLGLYCMGLSALPGPECFLFMLGKLLAIISSSIFLCPFFSLFSFLDHYNVSVGVFNVMPEVFEAVLTSFHSFYFILFCGSDLHQTICFPAHLLILLPHLLCYSFQGLFISGTIFFISVYLFFKSSSSLLNIYILSLYIHSVSVSEILDHLHYHYSEFFLWKIVYPCFTHLFFWGLCLLCLEHMPSHFVRLSVFVVSVLQAAGL